jgi:hypothetical protein
MIRDRSSGGKPDHTPDSNARLAASTAKSACSTAPFATVQTSSSLAGLRIS